MDRERKAIVQICQSSGHVLKDGHFCGEGDVGCVLQNPVQAKLQSFNGGTTAGIYSVEKTSNQTSPENSYSAQLILHDARPTGRLLGRGFYGTVKELEMGGLVCTGKELYNVFIAPEDVRRMVDRYYGVCSLLSAMRHPNIVLFLGLCFLPVPCGSPVLPSCLHPYASPNESFKRPV